MIESRWITPVDAVLKHKPPTAWVESQHEATLCENGYEPQDYDEGPGGVGYVLVNFEGDSE